MTCEVMCISDEYWQILKEFAIDHITVESRCYESYGGGGGENIFITQNFQSTKTGKIDFQTTIDMHRIFIAIERTSVCHSDPCE